MCLPKKILKWCSNHAKKHLRYKFKILCSVHSITIKINFNIFYHKIKALWIFIMCGLSKCLIRMKNNSPSGIAQWRKIYPLLKMFGAHSTLLVDALDGGKTQDFVNALERKQNNMKPPTNSIQRNSFVSAFSTKTYILCQSTKTKGQSLKSLQRARLSVI